MKNRILVIEDDTAISELISMNLTVAGYDTEALFDGNEVEELLKTDRNFDLALLDVMLPGKDGFELMDLVKEAKIPVIYLTAKSDVGSKDPGDFVPERRITLSSLSKCWSFWSASKKCWSGPDGRSAGSLWAISRST